LSRKGSRVATWPEAPSLSPSRRGLWSRHVPHGSRPTPCAGRLRRRHVTEALGPPLGRAPVSPHVLWLQTLLLVREGSRAAMCPMDLDLWCARAFSRFLTSRSSWPRQARGVGITLNTHVIGYMQRMTDIKCVQDVDMAGWR
jgi:hypothetical protein